MPVPENGSLAAYYFLYLFNGRQVTRTILLPGPESLCVQKLRSFLSFRWKETLDLNLILNVRLWPWSLSNGLSDSAHASFLLFNEPSPRERPFIRK